MSSSSSSSKPAAAAAASSASDGRPIKASECSSLANSSLRTVIYNGIRERTSNGQYFVSVGNALPESLCTELESNGFRVLRGKHAAIIEWDDA